MKKLLSILIATTIATSSYGLEEHWIVDSGVIQIDKQQDGRYSYSLIIFPVH
jgi:hypothetical protein